MLQALLKDTTLATVVFEEKKQRRKERVMGF